MLMKLRVADYPNMKASDKKKTHRQMHRLAYPKNESGEKLTTEELGKRLRAAIHG